MQQHLKAYSRRINSWLLALWTLSQIKWKLSRLRYLISIKSYGIEGYATCTKFNLCPSPKMKGILPPPYFCIFQPLSIHTGKACDVEPSPLFFTQKFIRLLPHSARSVALPISKPIIHRFSFIVSSKCYAEFRYEKALGSILCRAEKFSFQK